MSSSMMGKNILFIEKFSSFDNYYVLFYKFFTDITFALINSREYAVIIYWLPNRVHNFINILTNFS